MRRPPSRVRSSLIGTSGSGCGTDSVEVSAVVRCRFAGRGEALGILGHVVVGIRIGR